MTDREELLALRSALREKFDTHPVAALALDESGKVVYASPLSRALLPGVRLGGRITRLFPEGLGENPESFRVLPAGDGTPYLFCRDEVGDAPVKLYYLQRLSDERITAEFSEMLLSYGEDLIRLSGALAGKARGAKERAEHLAKLSDCRAAQENCTRLLKHAIRGVRDLAPGRVFAVSAGELCSFLSRSFSAPLDALGARLSASCEKGLVVLVNFRDFCESAVCFLDFFLSFVLSGEVVLTVRRDGEECLFDFKGEDAFHILSLYRVCARKGAPPRELLKQCALFFPLFYALSLLHRYGHRAEICHEDGFLHVTVRVAATTLLPTLVVRAEDRLTPDAEEVRAFAEGYLFGKDLLARIRAGLKPHPPLPPCLLRGSAEADLFPEDAN